MGEPSLGIPPSARPLEDRLDSWKEIAAYLNRDVTTVQRWEKREGMPVHRHLHDRMGSVYASRAELDAWTRSRNLRAAQENGDNRSVADPPPPPRPVDGLDQMVVRLAAGSGGSRAGDWRKPLAAEDGVLSGETRSRRAISDSHRLRRSGAGGRGVARRPFRGVSVGSRRTDGRLGHADRFGPVPQPDPRQCSGTRQSVDPHAWASRPTDLSSRSGFASQAARTAATSASGRYQYWAASRGHTSKAWPSSTGRTTARGSCTTRPAPETRCSCQTAACDRRAGPSSLRLPGSTLTFRCGRPTRHSSTSSRVPFPTSWTSGASRQPAEPLNGSRRTMRE